MSSLLQNKYVRFGLFGLGALVLLFIFLAIVLASFNSARSGSTGFSQNIAPGYDGEMMDMMIVDESFAPGAPSAGKMVYDGDSTSSYYPNPTPDGYTSGLEQFETTSYKVSARSRELDALCDVLTTLKGDNAIHFKSLNSSVNNCNARFFVEENRVAGVLAQFAAFDSVELNRNTESVTRHKEQIESQSSIVRQQLASVERTLTEAEIAYDEIVTFAREQRDAATLSEAIREKLQQVDYLTQRKISLTSQLENYAQQAADLNERLDVVEFYATFNRSNPIQIGKTERMWESAWEDLSEQFTKTAIGMTAFFGIFLLYVVQYGLYLLVLIVVARFGWKFVLKMWRL